MIRRRYFLAVAAALVSALSSAPETRAQTEIGPTLAQVIKRGYLSCGVTEAAGFAQRDGTGEWRGFEVDLLPRRGERHSRRSGESAFLQLSPKERVGSLQTGWVDLLVSASPWT